VGENNRCDFGFNAGKQWRISYYALREKQSVAPQNISLPLSSDRVYPNHRVMDCI
jgi:hypothetical protein